MPTPARYRTTDWSSDTAALRKRPSLLVWLDKEMTWLAPHDGSPRAAISVRTASTRPGPHCPTGAD